MIFTVREISFFRLGGKDCVFMPVDWRVEIKEPFKKLQNGQFVDLYFLNKERDKKTLSIQKIKATILSSGETSAYIYFSLGSNIFSVLGDPHDPRFADFRNKDGLALYRLFVPKSAWESQFPSIILRTRVRPHKNF
jgi:hypothetical protein